MENSQLAAKVLGRPVESTTWEVTEVAYDSGSPATASLQRIHGATSDGAKWSAFRKGLQHVRHWPFLHMLPEHLREEFATEFPWRSELTMWEPGFVDRLPAGMRLPVLYEVEDLGDDRLAVWMENIAAVDESTWDLDRYRRAARALGGLSARRSDLSDESAAMRGWGLHTYMSGRVAQGFGPVLRAPELWQHPLLATGGPELRADMVELFDKADSILSTLDSLPQAMPHGDASAQNLLVPVDEPQTFVVIDISFQCPLAVGFDLGQLLVGLVHAGKMPAAQLGAVHAVLAPSYLEGYREHGGTATADEVTLGYVGSLVIRSGFTSIPFERLEAPGMADMFRERMELTRFIIDLGRKHF